jgi:hypothetical protein
LLQERVDLDVRLRFFDHVRNFDFTLGRHYPIVHERVLEALFGLAGIVLVRFADRLQLVLADDSNQRVETDVERLFPQDVHHLALALVRQHPFLERRLQTLDHGAVQISAMIGTHNARAEFIHVHLAVLLQGGIQLVVRVLLDHPVHDYGSTLLAEALLVLVGFEAVEDRLAIVVRAELVDGVGAHRDQRVIDRVVVDFLSFHFEHFLFAAIAQLLAHGLEALEHLGVAVLHVGTVRLDVCRTSGLQLRVEVDVLALLQQLGLQLLPALFRHGALEPADRVVGNLLAQTRHHFALGPSFAAESHREVLASHLELVREPVVLQRDDLEVLDADPARRVGLHGGVVLVRDETLHDVAFVVLLLGAAQRLHLFAAVLHYVRVQLGVLGFGFSERLHCHPALLAQVVEVLLQTHHLFASSSLVETQHGQVVQTHLFDFRLQVDADGSLPHHPLDLLQAARLDLELLVGGVGVSVQTGKDLGLVGGLLLLSLLPAGAGVAQFGGVILARPVQLGIQFEVARYEVLDLDEGVFALFRHVIGADVIHQAGHDASVAPFDVATDRLDDGIAGLVQDGVHSPVLAGVGLLH